MAKDFVGLNICVRDIFQGTGDCGHSLEKHGYSGLNTLGFTASTISGINRMDIEVKHLDKIDDQDYFVITASGEATYELTFGFASGSISTDVKIDTTGISPFPVDNPANASALGERIDSAILSIFNFNKLAVPTVIDYTASFSYEHCYTDVTVPPPIGAFSASAGIVSGSAFYNDVPTSFVGTNGILHAINLHRNGPYGWPTWKQIRTGENRINQYLRKHNKLTVVKPDDRIVASYSDGSTATIPRSNAEIVCFDEPSVASKHYPLVFNVGKTIFSGRTGRTRRFAIKSSYNNNITFFSNNEVNAMLKSPELEDENLELISNMYLKGGLDSEASPLSSFEFLKFRQTVFPREAHTYKSYTRSRPNYSNNYWRSSRADRALNAESAIYDNGFGTDLWNTSKWPLDHFTNGHNSESVRNAGLPNTNKSITDSPPGNDPGILQNSYCQVNSLLTPAADKNTQLAPAPIYNRRQTFWYISNYAHVSPSGMPSLRSPATALSPFKGNAWWEAAEQAGREPFYDSFGQFDVAIQKKYKEFVVVPEFKINEHIDFYSKNGVKEERPSLFHVPGGKSDSSSSADPSFYTIYSTTDFLKNFDIIVREHNNFVEPSSISLKCKAVKKFIPYDGFYPAQRTVAMAEQFYKSYKDDVRVTSLTGTAVDLTVDELNIGFQNLMQPLFAPGIVHNSIKSGVACDWPITLDNNDLYSSVGYAPDATGTGKGIMINKLDYRVPFEAVVNPEPYLANVTLPNLEVHASGALSASVVWGGNGDSFYKKMANNFCAEVPDFFLKNQGFKTLTSLPQGNPNFGNAVKNTTYKMRVKMYRSMTGSNFATASTDTVAGIFPQDICRGGYSETLTMYSRPTAFGPACWGSYAYTATSDPLPMTEGLFASSSTSTVYEKTWRNGYNFPFTPPYYHGQAWADITFVASETKKYTLAEIINSCSVEQTRFDTDPYIETYIPSSGGQTKVGPQSLSGNLINLNAMQLDSSINLFSRGKVKGEDLDDDDKDQKVRVVVDTIDDNTARWVIQPKFETPILNFNHITDVTSVAGDDENLIPRGMWHQYGLIPENNAGVFLQITDVPFSWRKTRKDINPAGLGALAASKIKSLADLCGFRDTPVRLGELADAKVIREAVVAVPFLDIEGSRKFFSLPRKDIVNAQIEITKNRVGKTVIDMVEKMSRYVFPPSMDFLSYDAVDPFAMYIFEFKHALSKQDLSYIWQNLIPDIGLTHEEAEASITHELLSHELLGEGAKVSVTEDGTLLDESAKNTKFDSNIRWMVFKVKQRAETDYYKKVVGRSDPSTAAASQDKINYNWPYDFFSLVELVKIDAEVEFSNVERDKDTRARRVKPVASRTNFDVDLSNPLSALGKPDK
jgi:hypothetical protein